MDPSTATTTAAAAAAAAVALGCALQCTSSEPEPEPEPEMAEMALLPMEQVLVPAVAAVAAARDRGDHETADRLTAEMLQAHALCKATARPSAPAGALPIGVAVTQLELQLDVFRFGKWLRTDEGRPWLAIGKGPSDDGLYTVSQLLRTHMPRGVSWFEVSDEASGQSKGLAVRGFKKFTGLVEGDEDEESGATENNALFMYDGKCAADASRVVVTTKSNGENGKWAIRKCGDHLLCFAGSKHATRVWGEGVDPRPLYPLSNAPSYVPSDTIVHAMYGFLEGMETSTRANFTALVASNEWTLMLEYNSWLSEHVFPITEDFVDFLAVLDPAGVPIPQAEAFAFFDKFGLPRVECASYPATELDSVVEKVRTRTDNEGVVIYLEDGSGACIGLVKVKTDHYVIARRTRQTFWGALVGPMLSGKLSDGPVPQKSGKGGGKGQKGIAVKGGSTIAECLKETERRLRNGMRTLTHVKGCAEHWEEWFGRAMGFVDHWMLQYNALSTQEEKKEFAEDSKRKFGSLYAEYIAKVLSPGYRAALVAVVSATQRLQEHTRWAEHVDVTQELRECRLAISGYQEAIANAQGTNTGETAAAKKKRKKKAAAAAAKAGAKEGAKEVESSSRELTDEQEAEVAAAKLAKKVQSMGQRLEGYRTGEKDLERRLADVEHVMVAEVLAQEQAIAALQAAASVGA